MKIKRIDHVGVVVRNMKEAISFYEDAFGATAGAPMERPDLGVTITLVKLGDGELELFCPLEQRPASSTGEAMQEFLDTRGEGIHHVAFAVEDIDGALGELREKGVALKDKVSRPGIHGKIAFLQRDASHGVPVELCEIPAQK